MRIRNNLLYLIVLALSLGGCVASNITQLVDALGRDQNQNCVIVTSIYGTLTMMRASPDSGFKASTGQCAIDAQTSAPGANKVTVPVEVPAMTLTTTPK